MSMNNEGISLSTGPGGILVTQVCNYKVLGLTVVLDFCCSSSPFGSKSPL